jgi:glycosyltransferase involved in cell wall biosynthesis
LAVGDIAVAPKLSRTEGNGKILNYMAIGLPVVAFEGSVARDYLGEDGIYAANGDVSQLARGIEILLADRKRAKEVGRRLRNRAIEKFSWETSAHKIEQAYASLVQPKRKPIPELEKQRTT